MKANTKTSAGDPISNARKFATTYMPRRAAGYAIHNEFFIPKDHFRSNDIQELLEDLHARGTFTPITNCATGLVQTSDTENSNMRRQWFTDSAMVGYWQRRSDPKNWKKALLVNAAALNTKDALAAVEETVRDPDWYREGGLMNGVYHIYLPKSVELDSDGVPMPDKIQRDSNWFNQKRLESHALMLMHLANSVIEGACEEPAVWAFSPAELFGRQGRLIIPALINTARYLIAANTQKTGMPDFHTPSASSWEEAPFKEGMTSDAAFTVIGLEKLHALLYTPSASPRLLEMRAWIAKHAEQLPPIPSQQQIDLSIQAGRAFVSERILAPLMEGLAPAQTPRRPADTSLVLLAASDYQFYPSDPVRNATVRYALVEYCKGELMGENGMRRYNEFELEGKLLHDSYLNVMYHQPPEERASLLGLTASARDYGSTDTSSVEAMADRQKLSRSEYAAQWSIGMSASLQALAEAKLELLRGVSGGEWRALVGKISTALDDMINRNMALIPGKLTDQGLVRSDGSALQPYQVMEAYEVVIDQNGKAVFIPGAHTLPWSMAQLFDGLSKAGLAAQSEEKQCSTAGRKSGRVIAR